MGDSERLSLADFARYLPRVRELGLLEDELRAVPVHAEPPPNDTFLSLGELPPGAPPLDSGARAFVGTRQIYVYHLDVPPRLWQLLATGLHPPRPSGSERTGMFGNSDEYVVDEDDPSHSWRVVNAGEWYHPPEL